jgi:hypothetical protein
MGEACRCFHAPYDQLKLADELGMDERYAQVSLLVCPHCGQHWLRYLYELEAITASGRWYLSAITSQQTSSMTAQKAKATLEALGWYFYGGSYYGGRQGRTQGLIRV